MLTFNIKLINILIKMYSPIKFSKADSNDEQTSTTI